MYDTVVCHVVVIEVIINVSKDPPPRLTLYALRAYDIRRLMNHSRLLLLSSGPHRFVRSSSTQRICCVVSPK